MTPDYNLEINPHKVETKIIEFIQSFLTKRAIDGLVFSYKDCIETIINIQIGIKVVGKENIKLLVTKGRLISPTPREKMNLEEINKYLGLPTNNILFMDKKRALMEIRELVEEEKKLLSGIAFSSPAFNYNLSYLLLRDLLRTELEEKTFEAPSSRPKSERDKFIQNAIAHYKSQIRLQMLLAYLVSETENKSFVGSTNKTEWLLGLFTKFGTYHAADFLPLAGLYRTQVLQLAEYLGLQEILESRLIHSTPNYQYFFDLTPDKVDSVLIRLESGVSVLKISEELVLPFESVEKINKFYETSKYARSVPLIPNFVSKLK